MRIYHLDNFQELIVLLNIGKPHYQKTWQSLHLLLEKEPLHHYQNYIENHPYLYKMF